MKNAEQPADHSPSKPTDRQDSAVDKVTTAQISSAEQDDLAAKRSKLGVKIVFTILVIWGAIIAAGTFRTQASTDVRRSLIVVLTMGTFLGTWAIALWLQSKKQSSQPSNRQPSKKQPTKKQL